MLSRSVSIFEFGRCEVSLRRFQLASICGAKSSSRTIVCVEGNIASGKTSIMDYVNSIAVPTGKRKGAQPALLIRPEPIDKWTNLCGINLLKRFYEDQQRKACSFQTWVQTSIVNQALATYRKRSARVIMYERSIISGRYVFTDCLYSSKIISDDEYYVLDQLFRLHWQYFQRQLRPDIIVYLRTTPAVCFDRIRSRNRDGESTVSVDYLHKLHDLHERLFLRTGTGNSTVLTDSNVFQHPDAPLSSTEFFETCLRNVPVIVIDCDRTLDAVQAEFYERVSNAIHAYRSRVSKSERVSEQAISDSSENADAYNSDSEVESEPSLKRMAS